ncbi:hypothetical protein D3C79_888150 [compost metagenome]
MPNHAENTLKLTSQQYGYTVHAGYPDGQSWQAIRHAMRAALPSLLLVGIMTSAAGYWGMFRRTKNVQHLRSPDSTHKKAIENPQWPFTVMALDYSAFSTPRRT